jgi:thioredoxin 1
MTGAIDLDDASLKAFLGKSKVTLIDFYADWCGPCQALKPVIDELAGEMKGKAGIAKMDIDQNRESAEKYGIMSIPTMLIFKGGRMVDRLVGALPKDMIKQRLGKFTE